MATLGGLGPTARLYREYWIALRTLLEERNSALTSAQCPSVNWFAFGIGDSQFRLDAAASVRKKWIYVSLTLRGSNAIPHFHLLEREKEDIKKGIGVELEWDKDPKRQQQYIRFFLYDADPDDRQDWGRQHQWLCEQLENFYRVFSPLVERLDASDYVPEENGTDE